MIEYRIGKSKTFEYRVYRTDAPPTFDETGTLPVRRDGGERLVLVDARIAERQASVYIDNHYFCAEVRNPEDVERVFNQFMEGWKISK